jgi:hypothetical protein
MKILVSQNYGLRVQPDHLGVRAKEALHQHRSGKDLSIAVLDGLKHSHADPGFPGDLLQVDLAAQTLVAKIFAKALHIGPHG